MDLPGPCFLIQFLNRHQNTCRYAAVDWIIFGHVTQGEQVLHNRHSLHSPFPARQTHKAAEENGGNIGQNIHF